MGRLWSFWGPQRRLAAIVGLLATVLGVGSLPAERGPQGTVPQPQEAVEQVKVTAQRFYFRPSRIKVARGKTLEITLESRDTFHGFHIPGASIDVLIPAAGRGTARVIFEAREPGKYEFECSRQCGAGHSQMRGQIVVE